MHELYTVEVLANMAGTVASWGEMVGAWPKAEYNARTAYGHQATRKATTMIRIIWVILRSALRDPCPLASVFEATWMMDWGGGTEED